MKIKCYDQYNQQELLIHLDYDGDAIDVDGFNSKACWAEIYVEFGALTGEDPTPSRWSDLINFEIVDGKKDVFMEKTKVLTDKNIVEALTYLKEIGEIDGEQKNNFDAIAKKQYELLRQESMANRGEEPKHCHDCYTYSFQTGEVTLVIYDSYLHEKYLIGNCHKTKEQAEAWRDKYSEAFLPENL